MRTGSAALVVAALGLICSASASAAITVPESKEPTSLAFKDGAASVTVVVTNTGADQVTLKIKFVGAGAPSGGLTLKGAAESGLSLTGQAGQMIDGHDAATVKLTFHRQNGTPDVSGAVVISTDDSVVTVPVTTPAAAAKTGFDQSTATLRVTEWVGPLARSCRWAFHWNGCPGQHPQGQDVTVDAKGAVEHVTHVGGDSGKRINVWLHPIVNGKAATLEATRIPQPSSYMGSVALDPSASPVQATTVTVHVRDALIWPLIAIGLGVVASYFLVARRDPKRVEEGLRLSLEEALEPYLAGRVDDVERPDRNYLDAILVKDANGLASEDEQCPTPARGVPKPTADFAKLYYETYSIGNADARAAKTAEVAAMVARFGRWEQLNDAFVDLEAAVANLPSGLRINHDGQAMLDRAEGEPAGDDEANDRAAAITSFTFVVHVYLEAEALWQAKDPGWKTTHKYLNPTTVYSESAHVSTTDEVATVRARLLRALRLLAHSGPVPEDRPNRSVLEDLNETAIAIDTGDLGTDTVIPRAVAPAPHHFRDSATIRRNVREWDWVVFLVVGFLTAVFYTLSFYNGKDWGSPTDYLLAFVSGATVTSVINWGLAPVTRTLTSGSKAPS